MTHVITRACCSDASCLPVCPVNCIHPTPDEPDFGTAEMLYIDPDGCVDCGACVDVCPVGAIAADDDLEPEQEIFAEINARWFALPQRRDYPEETTAAASPPWTVPQESPLRVAVVGSGPAGTYAVEALLARRGLQVEIDVVERLLTPGGLVRFGVAPDHQDTKAAGDLLDRLLRRPQVRLHLGIEVGRDVSLAELHERHHAVVWAGGAAGERRLGIPGEDLRGSRSARSLVNWYNGHPDHADDAPDLATERVVVLGNGNVALDVARLLALPADDVARTDMADHAVAALRASEVREVVVVGRRGVTEAAFSVPELVALVQLHRDGALELAVDPAELAVSEEILALHGPASMARYARDLLAAHAVNAAAPLTADTDLRRLTLRFGWAPRRLVGSADGADGSAGVVEAVELERSTLTVHDGRVVATGSGETATLPAGLVVASVGYRAEPVTGLPFDEARATLAHDLGRVSLAPATYATGWAKRGPTGVIGTNRQCARETVATLLDDYAAGRLADPVSPGAPLPVAGLDAAAWRRLDAAERSAGRSARRPRVKITDPAQQRAVAEGVA